MSRIIILLAVIPPILGALFFGKYQKWANEQIELPKDPKVKYGQLDNGFKFAWSQKPEGKDQCFLRLMVHVGSLHEKEDERGIAHFLEHLAFDGSENFAKGTLISWFQEMGMQFGPHLNAHTSFDETVYKIDMPRCTPERVKQALLVFRDFADGLLLEASEIEKERGIIDMEEQDRDSKDLRVSRKIMGEFYVGTTYADRLPIGVKNVRDDFNREKIAAFYKKWYRPDNMTLVLVGDFASKGPESEIRDVFSSMAKAVEGFSPIPDRGSLSGDHKEQVISEKDYPSINVNFLTLEQQEKPKYTKQYFFNRRMSRLINSLYSYKISQYLLGGKRDFYELSLVDGFDLDVMRTGVSFNLHKDDWEKGLNQATLLHNEIVTCGFSEDDLKTVLTGVERQLRDTLDSEQPEDVLEELLDDVRRDFPRLDPKNYMALYQEFLKTVSLEGLNKQLSSQFGHQNTFSANILVIGDFSDNRNQGLTAKIKEIVTNSLKSPVSCKKSDVLTFGYHSTPIKGEANYTLVENKGFNYHTVEFKNGVKAHLKKSVDPRMPKKILIKAKVGYGTWEFDNKDKALMNLGSTSLILGGTEKHPLSQVHTLLAGRDVSFSFTMNGDDSYFSGQSSPDDFLHYLEWNRAYIEEPAFGDQSIAKQKYNLIQDIVNSKNTYLGPLNKDFFKSLYDSDPRFSSLTKEQINDAEEKSIVIWMKKNLLSRCPEFTIVGDVEVEKAIQDLYQSFGDLKCVAQPSKNEILSKKLHLKAGVNKEYRIESKDPQALVGFYWPVQQGLKKNNVLVSVIQNIIDDRARNLLREGLSVAYTPQVSFIEGEDPWENNYLYVGITTDPSQIDIVLEKTPSIMKSFVKKSLTKIELDRAKSPVVEQMNLAMHSTRFWFNVIPVKQANFNSMEEAIEYLTTQKHEQVNSAILDIFNPDKFSSVVIKPEGK